MLIQNTTTMQEKKQEPETKTRKLHDVIFTLYLEVKWEVHSGSGNASQTLSWVREKFPKCSYATSALQRKSLHSTSANFQLNVDL